MPNISRSYRAGLSTLAPRTLPLAVLLILAAGMPARAEPQAGLPAGPLGGLHPYAGVGYFHDDNLFRLAPDQPAYDGQRGDSAASLSGALLFDKRYGRQKVFLQGKVSKVKFDHFRQLDYDGKDFLGLLNWQLGNRFEGSAGASYAQLLASYTDLRSRERNLRVQRRQHADGAWRMHPGWRVRAGAARDKYTYELTAQRVNDRTEDALEAGFDYLPRSGSTAGLVARRIEGKYLNGRFVGAALLNDNFTQYELKAKIDWKVTAASSLQALAGYARRKHAVLGPRDARGFDGKVTASLHPRQTLRLNGAAWRQFAPLESNLVTYSLNRGASAGASWDATAKVRVEAALSSERRRYEGRLLSNFPTEVRDRLRQASLGAAWSPRTSLQLSAAIARQRRTGADILGNGGFKSSTVSFSANAQF